MMRTAPRARREGKPSRLNHPNIAHIHGIEETDGGRAIVMELVAGDAGGAHAGGALPLDEALPIAKQIAEALSRARAGHHSSRSEAGQRQDPPRGLVKVSTSVRPRFVSRRASCATPAADSTATAALTLEGCPGNRRLYESRTGEGTRADPRAYLGLRLQAVRMLTAPACQAPTSPT
jgi:hypothetical protein